MWRQLRDEGFNVVSTWIDEAGPGETRNTAELWTRIQREVAASAFLILYVDRPDLPLKGALVEVGMALGLGKPVVVVLAETECWERAEQYTLLGSWTDHPKCEFATFAGVGLDAAHRVALAYCTRGSWRFWKARPGVLFVGTRVRVTSPKASFCPTGVIISVQDDEYTICHDHAPPTRSIDSVYYWAWKYQDVEPESLIAERWTGRGPVSP